jgi:hypothetical protein
MRLYETSMHLPVGLDGANPLKQIGDRVLESLPPSTTPIRVAVTQSDFGNVQLELGVMEHDPSKYPIASIFDFEKRSIENTREFNAVLLVPTGIGALVGGHAGDAGPTARLLASICDNLVTHPNVVNASDINEMTENTLYVEGSVICRLLMGTIGLQPVRSNRILTVVEKHPTDEIFVNGAINAVNAARASTGLRCSQILLLDPAMQLITEYSSSGRAVGHVERLTNLFDRLDELRGEYDSIALTSIIKIPTRALHKQYFESRGEMINPWGGVEAIFTHAISSAFDVQSAHSPMIEDQLVSNMDVGVVDPRLAAEAISFTYMQCILKGLQRAPKIITDRQLMAHAGVISASDVSCVIIPVGCIGIPTLAALAQGITVIAVRENTNIMRNDLSFLPWADDQLIIVDTYMEALGAMAALKAGIAIDTLRRPISNANVSKNGSKNSEVKAFHYPPQISKVGN